MCAQGGGIGSVWGCSRHLGAGIGCVLYVPGWGVFEGKVGNMRMRWMLSGVEVP